MNLQSEQESKLKKSKSIEHSGDSGVASELKWIDMLRDFLPDRYSIRKGAVIDSNDEISDSLDIIIFDTQYSPFILEEESTCYVPAESIYGTFEVRPVINRENIFYAGDKVQSVRTLNRTSAAIPHAGGEFDPIEPPEIIGGILALKSDWEDPLGKYFNKAIQDLDEKQILQLGCALEHGSFSIDHENNNEYNLKTYGEKIALVSFCFTLLSSLRQLGTAPAIKYNEYLEEIR